MVTPVGAGPPSDLGVLENLMLTSRAGDITERRVTFPGQDWLIVLPES